MLALAALALGVLATALLGVPAAGAQPAPPSTAAAAGPLTVSIAVQPFGTKTTARVTTSLPTVLKASTASPMGFVEAAAADGGVQPAVGAIRSGDVLSDSSYVTEHEFGLPDLRANTTYMVTVDATAQDGQTATATASFTTLKRRVRVTLREIDITDDGDFFGDGEPLWAIGLEWRNTAGGSAGSVGECFPVSAGICEPGSYGEGRFFPRAADRQFLAWTFAQENFDRFPDAFTLDVEAHEDDLIPVVGAVADFIQECNPVSGCRFSAQLPGDWYVPDGVEFASVSDDRKADDIHGGLHSRMIFTYELFHDRLSYPSERNKPSSTWR